MWILNFHRIQRQCGTTTLGDAATQTHLSQIFGMWILNLYTEFKDSWTYIPNCLSVNYYLHFEYLWGVYIHILNICTYKVFCVVTPPRVVCQTVYEFIRQFSTIKLQYCPLRIPTLNPEWQDRPLHNLQSVDFSILSHNYVRLACIHQSMILVNQQELCWKEE